ncbi:MAG: Uma2 family endonuclease [Isosphaeraceae bacterium]|nr:Uma2 family endonuclease [Isosphaeraceae bacterium]
MATGTERTKALTPPITVKEWGEVDGSPRYDLVDGRLREKPPVAYWHEILLVSLSSFVLTYVKARGLGHVVISNAKLKISETGGREPDLFFVPIDQYHLVGKNLFKGVPPLVAEVLSPSKEREDRVTKFREYALLGIGEYWIIDFANRRIEIYRLQPQPDGSNGYALAEAVEGETAIFRPSFFPGLEIPLAEVWPTEFEHRTDD